MRSPHRAGAADLLEGIAVARLEVISRSTDFEINDLHAITAEVVGDE